MANINSTEYANLIATPKVLSGPEAHGTLTTYSAQITMATASSGDVIRMFLIPPDFRPRRLLFSTDGAASTGAANIGLYNAKSQFNLSDDPTAIDADLFGTAVSLTSASRDVDVMAEAGTTTLLNRFQPLREYGNAGSALTDAQLELPLVLALTLTANVDAATIITLEAQGVI